MTRPDIPQPARSTSKSPKRAPRILVIDDFAEARDLYCALLEFHGFRTDEAGDGATGLAKARATQPDAILLDYSMPRMNGEQVLMALCTDYRTCTIPVLMLTAVPEFVGSKGRAECAAFLQKPCEPERLVATIHSVLKDRRAQ